MSARSAALEAAVEALAIADGERRSIMPLLEDIDPGCIIDNVRAVLAMLRQNGVIRAEAVANGCCTVDRDNPDYLEGERMVVGMMEHALAVARALLEEQREPRP